MIGEINRNEHTHAKYQCVSIEKLGERDNFTVLCNLTNRITSQNPIAFLSLGVPHIFCITQKN